jgi:hypothetical protein
LLAVGLGRLGLTERELAGLRQSDPRKQGLAWLLKSRTVVGDEWVCRRLQMGDRSNVSRAVAAYRGRNDRDRARIHRFLHVCTDFSESVCQPGFVWSVAVSFEAVSWQYVGSESVSGFWLSRGQLRRGGIKLLLAAAVSGSMVRRIIDQIPLLAHPPTSLLPSATSALQSVPRRASAGWPSGL